MPQQDLSSMFDSSSDLATRIEVASHMLKEAADDQGVDLSTFSQEDLSEMLSDIVADNDNGGAKTASDEGQGAGEVTYADVSLELTKRAAAEGVDLTDLDRETYEELFSKVAEELTNPEVAEEANKIAAQEAHMEELGRVAARGFVDEINKLAAEEEKKDDDKKDDDDEDEKEKKAAFKEKIKEKAKEFGGKALAHARSAGSAAGKKERGASSSIGEGIRKLRGKAPGKDQYGKDVRTGRAVMGGGAAAAAGGGAYAAKRDKKASLEEVSEAIATLRAAGFEL